MVLKYVLPGQRVDLRVADQGMEEKESNRKQYTSKVYDVLSEEQLEILMPLERTKLILLPVGVEYEIDFFTEHGIFQCQARVMDRYKAGSMYILLFDVTTDLKKHQRREFYRCSCVIPGKTRALTDEEAANIEEVLVLDISKEERDAMNECTVVDISGGGARLVSDQVYEIGKHMVVSYELLTTGKRKVYDLLGEILVAKKLENKPGFFEYRIQYVNIDSQDQEEIIRFIFEEERRNRQRG